MASKQARTRRGNNEGSVYQRADGLWVGMATIGVDENGKPKRKAVYGKSELEANKKLAEFTARIATNSFDYVDTHTFGELMNDWMLVYKRYQVSPQTFEHAYSNFNLHINSKIGKMQINEVNTMVIQKVLNEMLDNNYSLSTTKKVKFLFNQFFEFAVENKYVNVNPTQKIKIKTREKKIYTNENRYKALPTDVRDRFIAKLNKHELMKPLCLTMMFAGLRIGETLALRWENINFEKGTLEVEHGVTRVPTIDKTGKILKRDTVVSDTKTMGSVREIPIPDILLDALNEYKQIQWINGKTKGIDLIKPESYIFSNTNGTVRTYHGTKAIFYRFLKKEGLQNEGIHFHRLRHTYSNMLFESNQNPKVIQALLGHKSVSTTIKVYNSVDKSYLKSATNVFNEKYSKDKQEELKKEETIDNKINKLSADEIDLVIEELIKKKKAITSEGNNIAYEEQEDEQEEIEQEDDDFEM